MNHWSRADGCSTYQRLASRAMWLVINLTVTADGGANVSQVQTFATS